MASHDAWTFAPKGNVDTKVGVDVRVVAAGVTRSGGRRVARMALALSPSAAAAPAAEADLFDWPTSIAAIMDRGIDIVVSPLAGGKTRPAPDPGASKPLRVRRTGQPIELERLCVAWRHLMAPRITGDGRAAERNPWEVLMEVVREGTESSAKDLKEVAKSIVGVPRGDIALFLSIWRARVLLHKLGYPTNELKEPMCDLNGASHDWRFRPTAIDIIAPTGNTPINELLRDRKANAEQQFLARSRYLDSSNSKAALEALFKLGPDPACRCAAPHDLIDAVALADADALDRILKRHMILHELSLKPDEKQEKERRDFDKAATALLEKLKEEREKPKSERANILNAALPVAREDWTRPPTDERFYAQSRLFAIQANPALARAFNFVVDVEVDIDGDHETLPKLIELAGGKPFYEADTVDTVAPDDTKTPITTTRPTRTHYLYLAARPATKPEFVPKIWTIAKLRVESDGGEAGSFLGHFLPCTRQEIDIAAALMEDPKSAYESLEHRKHDVVCEKLCNDHRRFILPAVCDGAIPEFDGVVDLGAGRRHFEPKRRRPRYDIVSLDGVTALSHQIELVRSAWSKTANTSEDEKIDEKRSRAGRVVARPTLTTEGMVIVDRWHGSSCVFEIADGAHAANSEKVGRAVVLDATDLVTGFRVDVGVRLTNDIAARHTWRSLCGRFVEYEYVKDPNLVEDVLKSLGYEYGKDDRVRLDAAPGMVPLKRHKDDDGELRFAEEIVATWHGEPLGLQCRQDEVYIDPRTSLGISIDYDIPAGESGKAFVPPRLIFGKRYRLGIRQVYLGGVVTPLQRAAAMYEEAGGGMLALPGAAVPEGKAWRPESPDVPRIRGRRFLRHERLKSPTVLMPAAPPPDPGKHPADDSRSVVLRSAWNTANQPLTGSETVKATRIVVAPCEPQDFVLRHGELNGKSETVEIHKSHLLVDGLPNVAYTHKCGGFESRKIDGKEEAVFRVVQTTPRSRTEERRVPYFPDPAARKIAFAVRRCRYGSKDDPGRDSDSDSDYLDGKPLVVNLAFTGTAKYPANIASIYIEFVRDDGVDAGDRKQQDVIAREVREGVIKTDGTFVPGRLDGWKEESGTAPAKKVKIALRTGEDYHLDMWCCPTERDLNRWFDITESSAMLSVARGSGLGGTNADNSCVEGLKAFLKLEASVDELATELKSADRSQLIGPECGAGAALLPCDKARLGIATIIAKRMESRPLHEIASVETIRMTHAVSRPIHKPAFVAKEPLRVARDVCLPLADPAPDRERTGLAVLRPSYMQKDKETIDEARRRFVAATPSDKWTRNGSALGATDLLVGGDILLDLETSQSVTVYAEMTHPRTTHLDDPRRTRSDCSMALNRLEDPKDSEKLYGFRVDCDGRVDFPLQREVLLRLTNLMPPDDMSARRSGNDKVDLLTEPVLGGGVQMRRDLERCFVPDHTHARRMIVSLSAHSRFSSAFGDEKELSRQRSSLQVDEDRSPALRYSNARPEDGEVEIWIPATERPRPIDPKGIAPAFVWRETRTVDTRGVSVHANQRTVVRLRFRRPWFSSGEGERLGIILGPPSILDEHTRNSPLAWLVKKPGTAPSPQLEPYVTRWGADPIGRGNVPATDFMPLEAFPDAFCGLEEADKSNRTNASRVRNVAMPLPDAEGDGKTPKTVDVALLTYEPRFDTADQTWYVDIEIASGGVPNCFVRFGLVRYQQASLPGLEVSEPTTVMVQILPERDVRVRQRSATEKGGDIFDVEVEGPAQVESGQPESHPIWHVPMIRPLLLCVDRLMSGGVEVTPASCVPDRRHELQSLPVTGEDGIKVVMPRLGGKGLLWMHRFKLDPQQHLGPEQLQERGIASRSYRILLEEVEVRPLAEHRSDGKLEPVVSGPRFAATIDIP